MGLGVLFSLNQFSEYFLARNGERQLFAAIANNDRLWEMHRAWGWFSSFHVACESFMEIPRLSSLLDALMYSDWGHLPSVTQSFTFITDHPLLFLYNSVQGSIPTSIQRLCLVESGDSNIDLNLQNSNLVSWSHYMWRSCTCPVINTPKGNVLTHVLQLSYVKIIFKISLRCAKTDKFNVIYIHKENNTNHSYYLVIHTTMYLPVSIQNVTTTSKSS